MATGKRKQKGGKRKRKGGPDNPAQSKKFMESAKALGVDESGEAFKRALDTLIPKKGRKNGTN